jgi:hypothetical protein
MDHIGEVEMNVDMFDEADAFSVGDRTSREEDINRACHNG